jgi:hypothetical protein
MTESIIRETTRLRAELQNGSVDTRFDLPVSIKEQARETQRNIKENAGVPVDYSQVLIMAIRRGLAMIDNELTAEYNADVLDYQVKEATEQERNIAEHYNNRPDWSEQPTDEQKAAWMDWHNNKSNK